VEVVQSFMMARHDLATLVSEDDALFAMPDMTALAILGTSAPLALKLLGPTADYLGQRLVDTTKAAENLVRVVVRAGEKVGAPKLQQAGVVPSRVLVAVTREATQAEDEIMAEYLSGVLAASRQGTDEEPDDRGVAMVACVARLSSLTVRLHFLLHRAMWESLASLDADDRPGWRDDTYLRVPRNALNAEIPGDDDEAWIATFSHAMWSLQREDLIIFRPVIQEDGHPAPYLCFKPTALGEELFVFALGHRFSSDVFDRDVRLDFAPDLPRFAEAHLVPASEIDHKERTAQAQWMIKTVAEAAMHRDSDSS
jgi:hypothetical protein